MNKDKGAKSRKNLSGGGRPLISFDLDQILMDWILSEREECHRVSRKAIKRKANEFFMQVDDAKKLKFHKRAPPGRARSTHDTQDGR